MKTIFLAAPDGTTPLALVGEVRLLDGSEARLLRTPGGKLKLAHPARIHEDRETARAAFRRLRAYRERAGRGLSYDAAAAKLAAKQEGRRR